MKTNTYGNEQLDERQLILRNKFGFQSFVLLVALVFGYAILQQYGAYVPKPLDSAFIIAFTAVGYYQIRTILAGIYTKSKLLVFILCYAFIAVMAITSIFPFYSVNSFSRCLWSIFMFIYSLTISLISFVTWRKDKKSEKNIDKFSVEE